MNTERTVRCTGIDGNCPLHWKPHGPNGEPPNAVWGQPLETKDNCPHCGRGNAKPTLEAVFAILDDLTREWIQYDYSPWNGPSICHWCSAPVTYGKPKWRDRPAIPDSAVHADDCLYVLARAILDSPTSFSPPITEI